MEDHFMKRLILLTISLTTLLTSVASYSGVHFRFNVGFPAPCRPVYVVQQPVYACPVVVRHRPVYVAPVACCHPVRKVQRVRYCAPRPRLGFNIGFGL